MKYIAIILLSSFAIMGCKKNSDTNNNSTPPTSTFVIKMDGKQWSTSGYLTGSNEEGTKISFDPTMKYWRLIAKIKNISKTIGLDITEPNIPYAKLVVGNYHSTDTGNWNPYLSAGYTYTGQDNYTTITEIKNGYASGTFTSKKVEAYKTQTDYYYTTMDVTFTNVKIEE